ncbi:MULTISPECIES: hypothetical protein [unclassified Meridianimarinicoccus]|uniref:hypothetical protein n=1 Tax=unclassified Meridianimarinicoccus TaxID=2923344 RepID=UPI001867F143|nr:hypothetical protein [Fluviibacterium sp. MJW13]
MFITRIFGGVAIAVGLSGCAPEGYDDNPLFAPPETLEVPEIRSTLAVLDANPVDSEPDAIQTELTARGEDLRRRAEDLRNAP